MKKEDFINILNKYRRGVASEEEQAFLFAYYDLFEQDQDILDQKDPESVQELKRRIKNEIDQRAIETSGDHRKQHGLGYAVWLAAAVLLMAGTFSYYLGYWAPEARKPVIAGKVVKPREDILPGRSQALLTLENGESIPLNDLRAGLVRQQSGVSVRKVADGQLVYQATGSSRAFMSTVSTPRGGQYQLTLADGTKVWLNAASSLRFPSVFQDSVRLVELTGEAYFEVASDPGKPFKVSSEGQLIQVLGTHFNVSTYPDEPSAKTTLLEGRVMISLVASQDGSDRADSRIMKPGQQAVVGRGGQRIVLKPVDVAESIAWKNGYFKFDKADIQTVIRQICRWYDVEATYRGTAGTDLFSGEIRRDEDIANVLRIIELNNVDVKIKEREIIITH